MSPDVVQISAMALLFAVLTAGFAIARSIFDRMFKQMDEYFQFVQSRSKASDDSRDAQLKAWIDANRDQIKASVVIAENMSSVAETMGEVLYILRRMNGKEPHA